ncbi:uncharacterized protein LOC130965939 [Arachis stenosperma]|uniref:uncharacterized protein LOC130965939 n=1 Tax=Arachis stenosperma TaxID=217475 RepID=UPI0025AB8429|nr:uncharacterized protein LOC130965939 [Arachis stenosperma]
MDSEESFVTLVHCSGKSQKSKRDNVKFTDREQLSVFIWSSNTLSEIKINILQKLGVCGIKWVKKLFYKIPITVVSTSVKYDTFVIGSDADMQSTSLGGASTLIPVVAPAIPLVEPPSVALGMASAPRLIPNFAGEGELDQVENAMREDDLDEEPVDIVGDIDEDTLRNPPIQHGPSSFGTQQHPPHFSTLNLEAINQQPDVDPTFGGQGLHDGTAPTKFQIGQSFQSKEEDVLSVKDYNIHCEVEYRVVESDHFKYHGRCKEFGKGCAWLIRITLRQRKGT